MPTNQLSRQWTIQRELTASRMGRTLRQLARETEVHERTARRDIRTDRGQALSAIGVRLYQP
jgi:predicted DNA-binding transcriptional regulator YafY